MKIFSSISFKFIFTTAVLVLLPSIYIGYRLININMRTTENNIQEIHTKQVEAIKEKIDEKSAVVNRIIASIIQVRRAGDPGFEKNVLSVIFRISNYLLAVYTADENGKVSIESQQAIPDFELPTDISKDELFISARREKKIMRGKMENFGFIPGQRWIIPIQGRYLSVIIGFQDIRDDIRDKKIFNTGIIYLVDSEMNIVFHPDEKYEKDRVSIKGTKIADQLSSAQSIGATEYEHNGKMMIGAYSPLEKFGFIVSQQVKDDAYSAVIEMRRNAVRIISVSLFLALLIAVFFARGLTRPILEITKVAQNVADGDYSAAVRLRTKDELSVLGNTFNMMTAKIKAYADMQIEKMLLEKAKMEAILFSIEDGVIMTDYSGSVLLINETARSMFGIGLQDRTENVNIFELLKDEKIRSAAARLLENEDRQYKTELDLSDPDAARIFQLDKSDVKSPKDDTALGRMMIIHDITLEKEIERMKEDFIHSITHDLRTPMTSIRGFLEFLKDGTVGPLNEQQTKFIGIIDRSSLKLLGMINDILDVAKLESGKMQVELAETNLAETVGKVAESMTPQAQDSSITLSVLIAENLPVISADNDLLERVITNLVGNALKFTPQNGTITVSVSGESGGVRVSIKDTGEGMPKEFLGRIFSKFQQSSTKHRKKGTGLGLTICKYVVEAHLGKIWVESEQGKGSEFIFTIPSGLARTEDGRIFLNA